MKTAVSIPDTVFDAAEQLAQRLDISRSQLYTQAVEVFVRKYRNEGITAALDQIYAEEPSELNPAWTALQAAALPANEW